VEGQITIRIRLLHLSWRPPKMYQWKLWLKVLEGTGQLARRWRPG